MENSEFEPRQSEQPSLQPLVDWLWSALDDSGLSRNQLANRSGWAKTAVYDYFAGRRRPPLAQARDLATALGHPPAEVDAVWQATAATADPPTASVPAGVAESFVRALNAQVAALEAIDFVPGSGLLAGSPSPIDPYIERLLVDRDGESRTLSDAVGVGRRVVVLGDAGTGKTMLTNRFARAVASTSDGALCGVFLLTVRDHLGELTSSRTSLLQHLEANCRYPYNVTPPDKVVEEVLSALPSLVVIDGFDEIGDVEDRRRFARLINSFAHRYGKAGIVVTSRSIGYDESPLDNDLFHSWELREFTQTDITAFVEKWFSSTGDAAGARTESEKFLAMSISLEALRANPLLLTLLVSLFPQSNYDMSNGAEIYARCSELLIDEWDRVRGADRVTRFAPYVTLAMRRMATEVFPSTAELAIPRARARHILQTCLGEGRLPGPEADYEAGEFLRYCAGRKSVLRVMHEDLQSVKYVFAHRTFLEFFVALDVFDSSSQPGDLVHYIAAHSHEAVYDMVNQFIVQLCQVRRPEWLGEMCEDLLAERGRSRSFGTRLNLIALVLDDLSSRPDLIQRVCVEALNLGSARYNIVTRYLYYVIDWDDRALSTIFALRSPVVVGSAAQVIAAQLREPGLEKFRIMRNILRGDGLGILDSRPLSTEVCRLLIADKVRPLPPEAKWSPFWWPSEVAEQIGWVYLEPELAGRSYPSYASRILRALAGPDSQRLFAHTELERLFASLREIEFPWITVIYDQMHDGVAIHVADDKLPDRNQLALLPPAIAGATLLLMLPIFESSSNKALPMLFGGGERGPQLDTERLRSEPEFARIPKQAWTRVEAWLTGSNAIENCE